MTLEQLTSIKKQMAKLVARYELNRNSYIKGGERYKELDTRAEYIDPFFEILGWDLINRAGKDNRLREVAREVAESSKFPDYSFRLGAETKFFVEAKKPSVKIADHVQTASDAAYQVRRYGWTRELLISVLTNFEDLVIYDTTTQPNVGDSPENSRLRKYHYTEYVEKLEEIADLLSREAVYSGHFDEKFSKITANRPGEKITNFFLAQLNEWRVEVAQDLYQTNPDLSVEELNEVTQKFILRILFLRMCEDKGIQTYEKLKEIAATNEWTDFVGFLTECDAKYNSGLFETEGDPFTEQAEQFNLTPELVLGIINSLYYPNVPYDFSVLEPEFLGSVYEQFLVERVEVDEEQIKLVKKPENADRDVVSTPEAVIEKIVQDVFSPVLREATSKQILSTKVLDPATGSGGFLISAFGYFADALAKAYLREGNQNAIYETANGWQIKFEEKVKLLINCFYGVDRDYLAVEVAKFSLLVKLLENETRESLPKKEKILPQLCDNLIFGDSLVDDRIYENQPDANLVGVTLNWQEPLPDKYDFIIGNPPYLKTEDMRKFEPAEHAFYLSHYKTSFKQFDKYYLFLERSLRDLLKPSGRLGMILSRKFSNIESGKKIRQLLSDPNKSLRIVDFGNAQLFDGKTTYTCLLFVSPAGAEDKEHFYYEPVYSPKDWIVSFTESDKVMMLPRKLIDKGNSWVLPGSADELSLIEALNVNTIPLGKIMDVFNGIQTSKDSVYVITGWEQVSDELVKFHVDGQDWLIENKILKPFFDNELGELKTFFPLSTSAKVIYPYKIIESEKGLQAEVIRPKELADNFPHAWKWIKFNEADLRKRSISPSNYPRDEWYRYGRSQALTVFINREKIVVGVNSKGDKYAIDNTDTLLASGGTAGECAIAHFLNPEKRSDYNLFFILALLNHKAIEYFCRKRGSPFAHGWYSRGTAVLEEIPVPIINFKIEDERLKLYTEITQHSRYLCAEYPELHRKTGSAHARAKKEIERNETEMNRKISQLYSIEVIIGNIGLPT